jgi:N-acetylneuraminic acid mutarotase
MHWNWNALTDFDIRDYWEDYIEQGENLYGINARAFAYFSITPLQFKKHPDLQTPTLKLLQNAVIVKSARQVGRHLYVELGSEEELNYVFDLFDNKKELQFGEEFSVQPVLKKLQRKNFGL